MLYPRPRPGQASDIKSAALWTDIFELLNQWRSGMLTPQSSGSSKPAAIEIEGTVARGANEVLQLDELETGTAATKLARMDAPLITAIEPVWHSALDRLVIVPNGCIAGQVFSLPTLTWAAVACNVVQTTDRYVMLDPDNTTQMKSADAGIWRILGSDQANDYAIVDLTQGQPDWQYELTEDSQAPSTTLAKLLRMDGSEFAPGHLINLSDPRSFMDEQLSGEKGFCFLAGNKFYAYQSPC